MVSLEKILKERKMVSNEQPQVSNKEVALWNLKMNQKSKWHLLI